VSATPALVAQGRHRLETAHGPFEARVFRDAAGGTPCFALARGELAGSVPLVARVHSSCITSESFGACDCDCALQLDAALAEIAREGRGVVFYLLQEGRGAGIAAKARDRMLVQASRGRLTTYEAYARMGLAHDLRRYESVRAACEALGIAAPLALLTNNPEKIAGLAAAGVRIFDARALSRAPHAWNRHYLASKSRSGHRLGATAGPEAELPEAVEPFDPRPAAGAPSWLELSAYLLPVWADDARRSADWLRFHLYAPRAGGAEQVLLEHPVGAPPTGDVLVRVQRERLLERVAQKAPRGERAAWRAARRAILGHGAGLVLFAPTRMPWEEGEPALDDALLELVARHLRGRAARPLVAADAQGARDAAWLAAGLSRLGVAVAATRTLEPGA